MVESIPSPPPTSPDDRKTKKLELLLNRAKLLSHLKGEEGGKKGNKGDDDDSDESGPMVFRETPFYIKFAPLREYQIEGLNWLISLDHNKISGILADEMGLGKTLQSISLLGYCKHFKKISKYYLVICPKSTISNWVAEFKRWCPSLDVQALLGDQDERREFIANILRPGKFEVLVTTFEQCIIENKAIRRFQYEYVVIDEAHRIKNENSRLSEVVRLFKSNHRLLLTGTPLQNNLHELWALLNFLLPEFFSSSDDFDSWFQNEDCMENENGVVEKLHAVLRPFLLRRLKSDVEKKLLPKKEMKLYVGLTDMQREWYKGVLMKDIAALNGQSKENFRLNNVLMQLRKVCNHPYLFDGAEPEPFVTDEHLVKNCGKMILLDKLLGRLFEEKTHKVLLFSQMTAMLNIIEDYLLWKGYKYCRLDGNTSYDERQQYIADFCRPDSDKFIFILSTRAGGLGINLVAANIVIIFDSDWNPQMDLQAMDRAHRIGQKKAVKVFRLITEKTVEERIVERAEMKLKLDNIVIQQGRLVDQKSNKLSKEEMLTIIRHGAEEIIHSNASMITDEDIDAILKRAEDQSAKEKVEDKFTALIGKVQEEKPDSVPEMKDMYTFEGQDYKNQRIVAPVEYFPTMVGKRERKALNFDIEEEMFVKPSYTPKFPKIPKVQTVQDYQFYPPRLVEIINKEINIAKKQSGYRAPVMPDMTEEELAAVHEENDKIKSAEPLTDEELAEQKELMNKGYGNWSKKDFLAFVKANEKHGRDKVKEISESVPNKTQQEVMDYYNTFWSRYSELNDHARYIQQIERGEAKIKRHYTLIKALDEKVKQYDFPIYQLKIPFGSKVNKYFNEAEDRFMLVQLHKHGFGNPNFYTILQSEFRRSAEFRFDWFIKSRTQFELEKRMNTLLSSIEREYLEKQKYQTLVTKNGFNHDSSTTTAA